MGRIVDGHGTDDGGSAGGLLPGSSGKLPAASSSCPKVVTQFLPTSCDLQTTPQQPYSHNNSSYLFADKEETPAAPMMTDIDFDEKCFSELFPDLAVAEAGIEF